MKKISYDLPIIIVILIIIILVLVATAKLKFCLTNNATKVQASDEYSWEHGKVYTWVDHNNDVEYLIFYSDDGDISAVPRYVHPAGY